MTLPLGHLDAQKVARCPIAAWSCANLSKRVIFFVMLLATRVMLVPRVIELDHRSPEAKLEIKTLAWRK